MIKIKKIDQFEDIGRKTWSDVMSSSKVNYIFQTYEYVSTWWKYFGQNQKNRELLLLVVEDSGSIAAIAPLMITRPKFINKAVIQFVGTDICDYMDFIIEHKNYENCFFKIIEYLSRLSFLEIDLKYVPEGSKTIQNFDNDNGKNRIYQKICQVDACPYINLKKGWQEILKCLKSKLKAEIFRNERKLQEKGYLVFKSHTEKIPPEKLLKDYFDMHIKKWKYYSKSYSQFQYKHWREFITSLSSLMFNSGWLDLSYLEFNNYMVACHFGFKYNDRLYYYMPTFDPAFATYSPAKILIMKMIEHLHNYGLKEFDFLRGKEPYKMAWTKISRPIYNVLYYSKIVPLRYSGFIYRALHDSYAKNVKPVLKKIKPLMRELYKSKGDIV